jgi:cytochrome b561
MKTEISPSKRFDSAVITMHWLMLILLVAVFASIELRELYPKGTETRELFKTFHFMLGLTVFLLVWCRLGFRYMSKRPPIDPPIARWQHFLAMLTHIVLYLLMITMPIAGWAILSAEGKPIPFWGLELPALLSENKDLAHTIEELHETAGLVFYYTLALHACAALFHHYVVRDNTLRRMLPFKN